MLVREPECRATIDEIVANAWVEAGREHAERLPLVSVERLPEDAHVDIIQQMVSGGIALEQQILRHALCAQSRFFADSPSQTVPLNDKTPDSDSTE